MPNKQPDAGKSARAAKLREKIEKLSKGAGTPTGDPSEGSGEISPRDFIQKRMAELEKKKGT
jgi:hypothetical protein